MISIIEKQAAIEKLSELVKIFHHEGIGDVGTFNDWKKENSDKMKSLFEFPDTPGIPSITGLVKPFFHPTLPLVGLNYTPLAHNTLHEFPEGWTLPLRFCRGIIFDLETSRPVAIPFLKFFNYGENPETTILPNESFEATVKRDGHLGIIFRYRDQFILTTRGSFESPSAKLGQKILDQHLRKNNWKDGSFPSSTTLLTEIIHPQTKVYIDYDEQKSLEIIGAYRNNLVEDFNYFQLQNLGEALNLSVTPIWRGNSIEELKALMKDRSVENEEGYVVRFYNGLRVKFKFETYIGKMVGDKLGFTYLMQRINSGNLEKMISTLPEEIYDTALRMLGELMLRVSAPGTPKDKWRRLYDLPHNCSDSHFQGICRSFVKSLSI